MDKEGEFYQRIRNALAAITENMLVGDKIEKNKWPQAYVKKHNITNLFRVETGKETRLTYTILAEVEKKVVIVLEFFSTHKEYEKRFGYS